MAVGRRLAGVGEVKRVAARDPVLLRVAVADGLAVDPCPGARRGKGHAVVVALGPKAGLVAAKGDEDLAAKPCKRRLANSAHEVIPHDWRPCRHDCEAVAPEPVPHCHALAFRARPRRAHVEGHDDIAVFAFERLAERQRHLALEGEVERLVICENAPFRINGNLDWRAVGAAVDAFLVGDLVILEELGHSERVPPVVFCAMADGGVVGDAEAVLPSIGQGFLHNRLGPRPAAVGALREVLPVEDVASRKQELLEAEEHDTSSVGRDRRLYLAELPIESGEEPLPGKVEFLHGADIILGGGKTVKAFRARRPR